jgi:hypothetical protein
MAENNVFDIDAAGGQFEPVVVKFRGEHYRLGEDALGVMEACELHATLSGDAGEITSTQLMEALPSLLKAVCPTMPTDGLRTGEQLALVQAVTEVLRRVGELSFPTTDE